jgi:23S rRNA pseudouridine1911/1915/1917 synthase
MNNTIKLLIDKKNDGLRVDLYLSSKIDNFSRSFIKKIINNNNVRINNKIISSPSTKIKNLDVIEVDIFKNDTQKLVPTYIKLNIIFEDNDILIVNKPKGMVVHPGAGNFNNTLANALSYKYKNNLSNINGDLRPGIVHRIDKETSGLLVVAKNNSSHANLGRQFSNHTIERKYQCLVWGVVRPLNGQIETLISRNKKHRQLMMVSDINGKKAVTNYKTIKVYSIKDIPKISLIECELETGRTHQIRVHLNYKGASLLGDKQYGKKNLIFKKINKEFFNLMSKLDGQALHAQTLGFIHPVNKKMVRFKSKLPLNFKKILDLLNNLSS